FPTTSVNGVFGPTGKATVASVVPAYPAFSPTLVAGTQGVNVTLADPNAILNVTDILSVTGPMGNLDPAGFTVVNPSPSNPNAFEIVFPGGVTVGGQYTFKFRPNILVANPGATQGTPTTTFLVKLTSNVISGVSPLLQAGATAYTVTFASPPGFFTAANVTSITGPTGAAVPGPYTVTQVSPTTFTIG